MVETLKLMLILFVVLVDIGITILLLLTVIMEVMMTCIDLGMGGLIIQETHIIKMWQIPMTIL